MQFLREGGCGKTLLLHYSSRNINKNKIQTVYINCENFKHHSFPNVLIEILDSLFKEIEKHLSGWFGKKKRLKNSVSEIRERLHKLKQKADVQEESIKNTSTEEELVRLAIEGSVSKAVKIGASGSHDSKVANEIERTYQLRSDKLKDLNLELPRIKDNLQDIFENSSKIENIFIQIDDLYHLKRSDQPFVVDYLHRLCKDLPIYFKIATLRHVSSLYIDLNGQPIGAQERHDYQPINIDYTFTDFQRTSEQNKHILYEYGKSAGMSKSDIDSLFKGEGFNRLVMAGGGVPRDTLSLFLEALSNIKEGESIGKDDIRIMSKANFERRISELKQDSDGDEQDVLVKGIYAIRDFCLTKATNIFLISEKLLQQDDGLKNLLYRLLDYRIIHSAASALTHKSQSGTFQAFAIDIGCYAHLRKLDKRFNEIDVSARDAKDKIRSAPILEQDIFKANLKSASNKVENLFKDD